MVFGRAAERVEAIDRMVGRLNAAFLSSRTRKPSESSAKGLPSIPSKQLAIIEQGLRRVAKKRPLLPRPRFFPQVENTETTLARPGNVAADVYTETQGLGVVGGAVKVDATLRPHTFAASIPGVPYEVKATYKAHGPHDIFRPGQSAELDVTYFEYDGIGPDGRIKVKAVAHSNKPLHP